MSITGNGNTAFLPLLRVLVIFGMPAVCRSSGPAPGGDPGEGRVDPCPQKLTAQAALRPESVTASWELVRNEKFGLGTRRLGFCFCIVLRADICWSIWALSTRRDISWHQALSSVNTRGHEARLLLAGSSAPAGHRDFSGRAHTLPSRMTPPGAVPCAPPYHRLLPYSPG